MRYILTFFLFLSFLLGWQFTCSAQHDPLARIDSLRSVSLIATDTTLAVVFNQISWDYRNINIDSSIVYAQRALDLSKANQYSSGINHSLNYLGIAHRNLSDYSRALSYFFEALKSSEASKDSIEIGYSLINIGNIYIYQTNFEGAIAYFEKALRNAGSAISKDMSAYCHTNLGRSYTGLEDFVNAEKHYLIAREIREQMEDLDGIGIINVDLAGLLIKQNKLESALKLLEKNLISVKERKQTSTLAYSYLRMAIIYDLREELQKSSSYIEKALRLAKVAGLKNIESQTLELLSSNFEKRNKYRAALSNYKQYKMVHDQIFNEKITRKIEGHHSQYLVEKKAAENLYLKEQGVLNEIIIKRQESIILLTVVASVLFLSLAVIAFWFNNERKKLLAQIEKQKEVAFSHNNKLIDINNEKNNLIRILSHDLRAPINNIKGLTQVHQLDHKNEFSESENQTLNLIKSESDRLLSMISKILNVDTLEKDIESQPMERVNVTAIMDEVINSFTSASHTKEIELVTLFDQVPVYINGDKVHLHQVIENLVSNALKFSQSKSKIELDIKLPKNVVQISVKDEGPGLTYEDKNKIFKKFQTLSAKPTANEESTGLGLSIVKKYVTLMNGLVWHESELGKGTTFILEFKKV